MTNTVWQESASKGPKIQGRLARKPWQTIWRGECFIIKYDSPRAKSLPRFSPRTSIILGALEADFWKTFASNMREWCALLGIATPNCAIKVWKLSGAFDPTQASHFYIAQCGAPRPPLHNLIDLSTYLLVIRCRWVPPSASGTQASGTQAPPISLEIIETSKVHSKKLPPTPEGIMSVCV